MIASPNIERGRRYLLEDRCQETEEENSLASASPTSNIDAVLSEGTRTNLHAGRTVGWSDPPKSSLTLLTRRHELQLVLDQFVEM